MGVIDNEEQRKESAESPLLSVLQFCSYRSKFLVFSYAQPFFEVKKV